MGETINKESTSTETQPLNGQQPKSLDGGSLNAFYWYQIFNLIKLTLCFDVSLWGVCV